MESDFRCIFLRINALHCGVERCGDCLRKSNGPNRGLPVRPERFVNVKIVPRTIAIQQFAARSCDSHQQRTNIGQRVELGATDSRAYRVGLQRGRPTCFSAASSFASGSRWADCTSSRLGVSTVRVASG